MDLISNGKDTLGTATIVHKNEEMPFEGSITLKDATSGVGKSQMDLGRDGTENNNGTKDAFPGI